MQTRYGDLWEANGFHVIPTNLTIRRDGTAIMGRGVAQQAALRYRALPDAYGHFLRTRTHPQLFVHRDFQVICLPVKRHWSAHADLDLIRLGVQQLAALPYEIRPIALPLVGCGFGELSSRVVLPLLMQCLPDDRFLLVRRDAAATRRHAATLRPASRRDRSVGQTVPAAIARRSQAFTRHHVLCCFIFPRGGRMASVNKVILVGNLGGAPELRYTPSGKAMTRFSLATNEGWMDGEGNRQEHTEWHTIVVWNRQAEPCAQYLAKGSAVYIEGKLRTHEYTDKEGHTRSSTEIVAQRVQFLGTGQGKSAKVPVDVAGDSDAGEWDGTLHPIITDGSGDSPF